MGEKFRYFQGINLVFETGMAHKVNFDESLNLQLVDIKGGKITKENVIKTPNPYIHSVLKQSFSISEIIKDLSAHKDIKVYFIE